jgi:hypothetical protein
VAVSPSSIAAADLDLDGHLDIVTGNAPANAAAQALLGVTAGSKTVTVLTNFGPVQGADTTFFPRDYDQLRVTPAAVAAYDVDHDGRADVLVLGLEGVTPLLSACSP